MMSRVAILTPGRMRIQLGGRAERLDAATAYNVKLYHFAYSLGKPTSNALFWAITVVNNPRELTDVRLAIGSNAASVWWVNGRK